MNGIHELLVEGFDFDAAEQKALRFFARNLLARYEEAQVLSESSCSGLDPLFWARVETGMAENRRRSANLIAELREAGLTSLAELRDLPQGYESKLLHTLAHLLDGFFGVDSYFYNLVDDSHGLPEERHRQIKADPGGYWLLRVAFHTGPGEENSFTALRHQANSL